MRNPAPVRVYATGTKKKLVEMGYGLVATRGTARFLARNGVRCREVFKVHEGRPHIVDLIEKPLGILERGEFRKRVLEKVVDYVETFIRGVAA